MNSFIDPKTDFSRFMNKCLAVDHKLEGLRSAIRWIWGAQKCMGSSMAPSMSRPMNPCYLACVLLHRDLRMQKQSTQTFKRCGTAVSRENGNRKRASETTIMKTTQRTNKNPLRRTEAANHARSNRSEQCRFEPGALKRSLLYFPKHVAHLNL